MKRVEAIGVRVNAGSGRSSNRFKEADMDFKRLVTGMVFSGSLALIPSLAMAQEPGQRLENAGARKVARGERQEAKGARQVGRGERVERRGERNVARGERMEGRGEALERSGHVAAGERLERRGERVERRGERQE